MLVYLLKSGACLGILFLFYKLFLEKANMHLFKRFYLLTSLLFALIVPALVFTEYVEVPLTDNTNIQPAIATNEVMHVPQALESDVLDIAPILWGIYFIGLLFFGVKFFRNLFQILKRIRKNPKNRLIRFTQVLLQEKLPPHTFFSYIFLNKKKLDANEIPQEVLLHEETHAQQKHSWDVVFVELLQVIFWVNPFIYLSKKAIKLNHEFMADQAVLKKDIDKITYQNTLLSYLSPDSAKKYQPTMANPITNSSYSSIKKRFKVMKTHTSKNSILLRSLLLLPLLAVLLYGFSETRIETVVVDPIFEIANETGYTTKGNQPNQQNLDEWKNSDKYAIWIDGTHAKNSVLENHEPSDFGHYFLSYVHDNARSEKFPQSYQLSLYSIGAYEEQQEMESRILTININMDGQLLINGEMVPLAEVDTFVAQTIKEEKVVKAEIIADEQSPQGVIFDVQDILEKYDIAQIDIVGPQESYAPISKQEGATKKQLAEFNALAKKYNRQLSEEKSIQIYKTDVERLEYLHGLMTHEQRENAEPFPDFPEPPPPPKAPKAPKVKKGDKSNIPPPPPPPHTPDFEEEEERVIEKQESVIREQEILMEQQDVLTEEQESRMEEQEILMEEQESRMEEQEILIGEQEARMEEQEIIAVENRNSNFRMILPPSSPGEARDIVTKSRLDHVIEMAQKETIFYFSGKQISSDKAIEILKKNPETSVHIDMLNENPPVVKLSKRPIRTTVFRPVAPSPPLTHTPPTPKSPLDHVIEMAKKDAIFYYEGKEISSDKAIDILKKNKDINIDIRSTKGKRPTVKLSTEPISID